MEACDEIFLKSSHYLDSELSLSGSAAHYLIAHGNSLILLVKIGLPGTVHMKKKLIQAEVEESLARNITSLNWLFKIFWLLKHLLLSLSSHSVSYSFFIASPKYKSFNWQCWNEEPWQDCWSHVCAEVRHLLENHWCQDVLNNLNWEQRDVA